MAGRLAVGIDLGGTKILAGVVDTATGRVIARAKKKTGKDHTQDKLVNRISLVVDEALSAAGVQTKDLVGIGIGAAGIIDRDKGRILKAVNLGIENVSLKEPLKGIYKIPVRMGNDVEMATLGEMQYGAGRKCNDFMCVFVGTGIGAGIVCDGKPYHGSTGTAGELGHMIVVPNGHKCGCGSSGCLETYASRTAIAKQIVSQINGGMNSMVKNQIDMSSGILRSKALANAAQAKDRVVIEALDTAAYYLGIGLASAINWSNPAKVILGGGLIDALDYFYKQARKQALAMALADATSKLQIVKAELGDHSGIVGAAFLAASKN